MKSVSVIIPSRLATCGGTSGLFLHRAIRSVRSQTIGKLTRLEIIVGLDEGIEIPVEFDGDPDIRFAFSAGRSQASALNAAARLASGEYIAFLEDDDEWRPQFLEVALSALVHAGFVSSTQLEVSEDAKPIRIFEFPTPSGWVMPCKTWE